MTQIQDIRYTLIGQDDSTVLPDALVKLAIEDAKNLQSSQDETALRIYACYLIAKRWGTMGRVISSDGTSLEYVSAEELLKQYNSRIMKINQTDNANASGFIKISTSKDLAYDDTDKTIRARRSGDL